MQRDPPVEFTTDGLNSELAEYLDTDQLVTKLIPPDEQNTVPISHQSYREHDMDVPVYIGQATEFRISVNSPFIAHSPEAVDFSDEEKQTNSWTFAANREESMSSIQYVHRRMLERPKKRRTKSCVCTVSIRPPGSMQRHIVQVEEVPINCKQLRIRHSSVHYERVLALPQIMLTVQKKHYLKASTQDTT